MKSKRNVYILLFLVLLIWGVLGYRLFSYINKSEQNVESGTPQNFNTIDYKEPDYVKIEVNYRDPFTGETPEGNQNQLSKRVNENNLSNIDVSDNIPIPEKVILYKGLVSDTSDKKKVFMLSINGKTYLLSQGQKEDNIKVISGNAKQIVVVIDNKKEIIAITQ